MGEDATAEMKPSILKPLRLAYSPLPRTAKAIGISRRSESNWQRIRRQAYQRHGTACYYCGAQPDQRSHDCHEIFTINDTESIIRLVDIVPACRRCHDWADGKVWIQPQYFRTRTELDAFLRSRWGENYRHGKVFLLMGLPIEAYGAAHPVWENKRWGNMSRLADVTAYEAIRHFRLINRITLAEAREYILGAIQRQEERDRVTKWKVDYGEWHWAVGLSLGELYSPA